MKIKRRTLIYALTLIATLWVPAIIYTILWAAGAA